MTEIGNLKQIALVINAPGFKHIEKTLEERFTETNNVSRVTGNLFNDGRLVGKVEELAEILYTIQRLRKEIKEKGDMDD